MTNHDVVVDCPKCGEWIEDIDVHAFSDIRVEKTSVCFRTTAVCGRCGCEVPVVKYFAFDGFERLD